MKTRQQPQGSGVHFSLLKNHRAMAAFSKEPARVLPEKKSSSLLPRVHLYIELSMNLPRGLCIFMI